MREYMTVTYVRIDKNEDLMFIIHVYYTCLLYMFIMHVYYTCLVYTYDGYICKNYNKNIPVSVAPVSSVYSLGGWNYGNVKVCR